MNLKRDLKAVPETEEQAETEVQEKPERRKYSEAYKSRILKEANEAPRGGVASLLRREGLYKAQLSKWRAQERRKAHEELSPRKRGPKSLKNPLESELEKLKKKNEKLEKQLRQANALIGLQKKVAEVMGITLNENTDDE